MKKPVVYVDAACDLLYSSYYIYGLKKVFGKVRFSSKYFSQFKHNNGYFPVVIKDKDKLYKLVFDYGDTYKVDEFALEWSDVYGKININNDRFDLSNNPKVVTLGPGFGFKIYPKYKTIGLALLNYLRSWNRIPNKRRFFSDYWAQFKREPIEYYQPNLSKRDYIFFAGALWKKEEETNRLRANFIKGCKRVPEINFEGGFAPRSRNDIQGFEDLTMHASVPISDYLIKLKESAVVFNTPAILDCHGWKMGEFMALGKAMISTKPKNQLVHPLIDREHIHFVSGEEEDIYEAVKQLTQDDAYREKIEHNIRQYYVNYVSPEVSVMRLIEKLY